MRGWHADLLARHPWVTFLLPLIVYMGAGALEPSLPKLPSAGPQAATETADRPVSARERAAAAAQARYPIAYTIKIALTIAAMIFVLPGYRQFPLRVSPLAIVVGVVGVVLWIWLCRLDLERKLLAPLGLEKFLGLGERPAYNPLESLAATPAWAYTFLAIRFIGLALVVPIIEEFFLRGFVMRFVMREDFWKVAFGDVTPAAIAAGTIVPMLTHPSELLAAAVWFSLVTWLMIRTRNIWDCVAAHAVTNLLLGIYVVTQHQWQLW